MPELPEVETLKRELTAKIKNRVIMNIEVRVSKMSSLSPKVLNQRTKNVKIKAVHRRAKVLILELSNNYNLLIHLKLTGQLVFRSLTGQQTSGGHPIAQADQLPNKFTHVIFTFKDNSYLFFNDIRKFGWIRLLNKKETEEELEKFGVEPLTKEFTLNRFKEILKKRQKAKIKQVLLDQKMISGLGNIYVDESCYAAKIRPTRIVKTLKEKEIRDLYSNIKRILKLAISQKGTSANTYVQLDGSPGNMAKYLKVYGRKGEKCYQCQGKVERIKLNGRGTHFCPKCQQ